VANWNAEKLLDHVQELLGEPVGGFYNIATRLDQLNQAQRELVYETRALEDLAQIPVVIGDAEYPLPADFLTFTSEAPYLVEASGNRSTLEVIDPSLLSARIPHWQDPQHQGTPMYLLLRNETLVVYPTPTSAGDLFVPYVVDPAELADMADEPFNGSTRLNRFAPALAYKTAFINAIGRAPQIAGAFQDLFERQERLMRHHVRSNPQHKPGVRPPKGQYHGS
jgi:hypothetical protein